MRTGCLLTPKIIDGVPEVVCDDVLTHLRNLTLIDVRRPDEFDGELSHVPGARLVTLGPELDAFLGEHAKDDEIVFICRSGARSARATLQASAMGFAKCVNLQGGMLSWNERKLPTKQRNSGA